jgi:hypothetical protein
MVQDHFNLGPRSKGRIAQRILRRQGLLSNWALSSAAGPVMKLSLKLDMKRFTK